MARVRRLALLILALGAAGLSGPAEAAAQEPAPLWATVNACAPGTVGVRASVPGDGTGKQEYVRFSAQFWSELAHAWLPLGGNADSPWVAAGSSLALWNQAGWTFNVQPPLPGAVFLIRGVATIQWRDGAAVARTSTQVTRAGVAGVQEASPAGTSRASCQLP